MQTQQLIALCLVLGVVVMLCWPAQKRKKNVNRYVPKDWIKSERYKVEVEEIQNN